MRKYLMAARRLIVVMLVLLGVSTVVAIIAPDPVERAVENNQTDQTGSTGATGNTGDGDSTGKAGGGTTGFTGTTGGDGNPGADGVAESTGEDATGGRPAAALKTEVSDDGRTISISARVGRGRLSICARAQTRLILTLETDRPIDMSITDFGRSTAATPFAPAVFDLLLPADPGNYAVTELADGRSLATITTNSACGKPGSSVEN